MSKDNDFRIPKSEDYDVAVERHLKRCRSVFFKDDKVISNKDYEIDGVKYSVNSIFDMNSKRTAEDNIKYLMLKDIEKVS